jgi:hypothetical protein
VAWQRRGNLLYYYRSFRLPGGGVKTLYFGNAVAAEWAALLGLIRKVELAEEGGGRRAELARVEAADAALARLCRLGTLLARAALLAAGYRRHARGAWRKRRARKE